MKKPTIAAMQAPSTKETDTAIGPVLIADLKRLAATKPREAHVLAELLDAMLGAEPRGTYTPFTFISVEEKKVIEDVNLSLNTLAELYERAENRLPNPAPILAMLDHQLSVLDMQLHSRFMKYIGETDGGL
jgi:hypothetical protein